MLSTASKEFLGRRKGRKSARVIIEIAGEGIQNLKIGVSRRGPAEFN